MFAEQHVTIQVQDTANTELVFPVSLVDKAEIFDSLMGYVAEAIENGDDPLLALADHEINEQSEHELPANTIKKMETLHNEGRNHIWSYYTRNLVRPVALSRNKVDVVIGNPPWLSFRNTRDILRIELERQSKSVYNIWAGGRYTNRQDVAGLFFSRSVDLYLNLDGLIGFVMPHSALQTGQYAKWRTGEWKDDASGRTVNVDFSLKRAWDLERLSPNDFFPVAASVIFAQRKSDRAIPLGQFVERWEGSPGTENISRELATIVDTSWTSESVYAKNSRQGATLVPRCFFLVDKIQNPATLHAGQTVTVIPRRGKQDKSPWRDLDLTAISEVPIESAHVFDVYLGESVAPFVALGPLTAVLPVLDGDVSLPTDENGVGGVNIGRLRRRMRDRWKIISALWESNRSPNNPLDLLERIDYFRGLSTQLEWANNPDSVPIRIIYTQAGQPTATLLHNDHAIVDSRLYWTTCGDEQEAYYLLAIINSDVLYEQVAPLMTKGQFGARDLQKNLWKLPIPTFDSANLLHQEISKAGQVAAHGAEQLLGELRLQREQVTVRIARREIRTWLRESDEGRAVENLVRQLLDVPT